jgi:hypothetical protein
MSAERRIPDLAPPGAGVPWWQRLGGKHLLLPAYCRRLTWDGAPDLLEAQANRLLTAATEFTEEQLTCRVLVPRQIGLEDSSRFYSYGMVLEHLTIIGGHVGRIVVELTHDRVPRGTIRTADLKPEGETSFSESALLYLKMLAGFRQAALELTEDRNAGGRYAHPWFGPLDAYQWLCFAPFHQEIHIKQAARILSLGPVWWPPAP